MYEDRFVSHPPFPPHRSTAIGTGTAGSDTQSINQPSSHGAPLAVDTGSPNGPGANLNVRELAVEIATLMKQERQGNLDPINERDSYYSNNSLPQRQPRPLPEIRENTHGRNRSQETLPQYARSTGQ